jgi:hypothetical protein
MEIVIGPSRSKVTKSNRRHLSLWGKRKQKSDLMGKWSLQK